MTQQQSGTALEHKTLWAVCTYHCRAVGRAGGDRPAGNERACWAGAAGAVDTPILPRVVRVVHPHHLQVGRPHSGCCKRIARTYFVALHTVACASLALLGTRPYLRPCVRLALAKSEAELLLPWGADAGPLRRSTEALLPPPVSRLLHNGVAVSILSAPR